MGLGDASLPVDDDGEGQRSKVVSEALRDFHCVVPADQRRVVEVKLLGEASDLVGLIDGDADKLQAAGPELCLGANKLGHLFPTGLAPSRPKIDHEDLAPPLLQGLPGPAGIRKGQREQGVGSLGCPVPESKPGAGRQRDYRNNA